MFIDYQSMSVWQLLAFEAPGWGGTLLSGLLLSLEIAILGFLFGLVIGFLGALGKLGNSIVCRDLWACYTTAVRAIPELVLILLIYFALPNLLNSLLSLLGISNIEINGFIAGVLVISFVQGAYATEVIRSAMLAIPAGQIEAAHAFAMPKYKILYRISLPAMLPHALPGLSNLWLIATKDTALLAVVGFTELTLAARQAAGATKEQLLFLTVAGGLYLCISLVSDALFKYFIRRSNKGQMHG
ncbi:ABC transporter permease [Marinomonas sp. SBI22]|uniref:ABC transporter permease n=1 Tax=unclassified Marinomonas TaxID=196814 RepID=UPI0007AF8D4E|nr:MULTISPECIES: ABC transporter permease subunit [unclassified Marinomonas]KZM44211.1 ABC transporter permease [Marinomonas sp. SBI22]KZM45370.1 ABC transporter permease [Marinomonas sp. SBI8L]